MVVEAVEMHKAFQPYIDCLNPILHEIMTFLTFPFLKLSSVSAINPFIDCICSAIKPASVVQKRFFLSSKEVKSSKIA
ncbi:hypothetical protein KHA80_16700 [Anaerobacillus sp. HL2]|nr:hypothetical protein KHA80_16700 [Anaerobacillus sp. HL2]